MESFKRLGLSDPVLKAIEELGFEQPSDIQAQAIPLLLTGVDDFIGLAQTGTGKTAAFGLPLLERIDPNDRTTQALVLAPTRELGRQIAEQLEIYSKYLDRINLLAVYGGANIVPQIKALRKPQHIIIATPGRLIDLIKRKSVKLDQLRFLVLDEADEMLNMGFKEELDVILEYTPEEKQTWLFSATMSKDISRIVKQYMFEPTEVRINSKVKVNADIEHQFVVVRPSDRTAALVRFLDARPDMKGVVFCRTRRETQALSDHLLKKNYKADALHGDLSQHQRDRVMKRFKAHQLQVLIATDVAARGIDVNDLTHVIHHNLPDDLEYYTHRSGRTGRAGKKGISLAFVYGRDKSRLERLQKQLRISFQRVFVPKVQDIQAIRLKKWGIKILNTTTEGKVTPEILENVNELFAELSKEELIKKLLANEVRVLDLGDGRDLNEPIKKKSGDRGSNRNSKSRSKKSYGRREQRSGRGRSGRKRRR